MIQVTLRDAMRKVASTVGVVSVHHDGRPMAMTATAFCSVSLDPASFLVCVNQSASMHSALKVGSRFCMNLLGEDQSEVSAACGGARAAVERFSVGQWARNGEGVPYVEGAQSNLFCEVVQIVDCGTHAIIIGQVDAVEVTPDRAPLVYFDGRYVRVESHAA